MSDDHVLPVDDLSSPWHGVQRLYDLMSTPEHQEAARAAYWDAVERWQAEMAEIWREQRGR